MPLAVFGLYVTIEAARFSYLTEDGPGPGFLALWLGIAICTSVLCLIVVNQLRPAARPAWQAARLVRGSRAMFGWLALMGAVLLFPFLGFTLCLVLLTVFLIALMERRSIWSAVLVALGLGIGFHLIFVVALGLSVPEKPFGFLRGIARIGRA